jgi:hypothetical protein
MRGCLFTMALVVLFCIGIGAFCALLEVMFYLGCVCIWPVIFLVGISVLCTVVYWSIKIVKLTIDKIKSLF